MKKLLCLIILLFSFIRSEAQSDHICPHEKLYVHTDRANYERGDTVRFRAYLMDTRHEAMAYSRYVYAELLADSQVISREMVKDDHGVFSGYLSLGDTLRSGNYTLRFYTRHLSSLPAPRYFYRQIIVGGRSFQDYRKESGDETPTVIASTASAYKFAESVASAIGIGPCTDGFAYVAALAKETDVPVPYGLAGLDQKPVRHTGVVDAAAMPEAVLEALK